MNIDSHDVVHVVPYIPAEKNLPEITFRGVLLGVFLAVLLAASSTFVGLKIARTIAGSIPAALISMMVLRYCRNGNILENNMVQTIASAGETVAAGVIFTLPALILLGYWQSFNYLQTALIITIGGTLGVMFSVPLRRSMIVKDNLPYPEGLATGEILKAGEDTEGSTKSLIAGSVIAAGISFMQTALKTVGEQISYWTKTTNTAFGASLVLSPVMMAAGYIVGIRMLIAFGVGGFLTWAIGIPSYVYFYGLPEASNLESALSAIQKANFRYIGVGVLAVGGLWGVVSLIKQIGTAIKSSFASMKTQGGEFANSIRTDRDIPFKYVLMGIAVMAVFLFFLFATLIQTASFSISTPLFWAIVLFTTLFALVVSFVCSAIAAYVVGIVGTTSLPVSGISIAAIIAFSSALLAFLGSSINFTIDTEAAAEASALVIIFAGIIAVTASISGDNMQDLKAGQIVGATPWKQQMMLIIGVLASAFSIPFIIQTTFEAYGIGDIMPRPGMNPEHALPAPQATLMATIAKGFFAGDLPWTMIYIGGLLGIAAICIDEFLKRKGSSVRFPALIFALGIYLPLGYVIAFLIGGLISYAVEKKMHDAPRNDTDSGLLFASGIIAGEAILGAILTIPFAYFQSTDIFAINLEWLKPYENVLGLALYIMLGWLLYREGIKQQLPPTEKKAA